ncbi:hypothetical protein RJ640_016505 [Escallonia rubra]|uniref:Protein ORGANELLE TRANSCRIPT PROCESSING 51 n=1 Tax=Escallonia rubra TaxID=112253 RepID=A0AA88UN06_9ASTE|nr:hypothetical protein RJ640_016505 [Escallonia rubra]
MLLTRASDLCSPYPLLPYSKNPSSSPTKTLTRSMRTALKLLRTISTFPHSHHYHHRRRLLLRTLSLLHPPTPVTLSFSTTTPRRLSPFPALSTLPASSSTFVEQLAGEAEEPDDLDLSTNGDKERFDFDVCFGSVDARRFDVPSLEVKELEELPEQWRRSKLAWLCKELPVHKPATLIRILNAQRKWVRQEDMTYVAVHCMRIRENETGFRVYKWMVQQHWFRFDFALATKLADYMGKERKYSKCRELFDDVLNQGLVPSESTFHILTVAYLSSPAQGCLEEACSIFNRMIQLGGYRPRLSLHNSLFRALVSKPGGASKHYLKQAEFIFHNLVTSGLEVHKDIYGGLIWLHSYQDVADKERIASLRAEMQLAGIEETKEVLVSILRACSKEGDVEEAERTWIKLLSSGNSIPSQAFVHKMEVYARIGDPMRSLEIFREMQKQLASTSVVAFHKIIEVLCKAREIERAESLMEEFINSGLKPLMPSFIDLMDLYLNLDLHEKLELTFYQCLEKCRPNRTVYNLYLHSLVRVANLDKAEEMFDQMYRNVSIGVNARSCNTMLRGYISCEEYAKAEKIYELMCQKKYDIEPPLMEKIDYVLSLSKKVVKKPISLKFSKEQREILLGLLLGGLEIESDEGRRNHAICFYFREDCGTHYALRRHIHDQYHEWLAPFSKLTDDNDEIPCQFTTISHSYFGFYADQFWPKGQYVIPKLIHRWLSPRVLAYWYMYGGHRTSSGDILLNLKGSREGVDKIVKTLKTKSLDCRVKRKGRVFWIGFLGSNSTWFWKLIEPFVLDDLKDRLRAGHILDGMMENQNISFDCGSDSDEKTSFSNDDLS